MPKKMIARKVKKKYAWLRRSLHNQRGQAMIEFALVLPLIAIILMFLILVYAFIHDLITQHEWLRFQVRTEVGQLAPGPFTPVMRQRKAGVEIPGRMKRVLGRYRYEHTMTLNSYGGSFQGTGSWPSLYDTGGILVRNPKL